MATGERKLRKLVCLLVLTFAAPLLGAGDDFYESLYQRGVAHFRMGIYDAALRELKIAAFGFLETPAQFETAEAYVASAARRLQQTDEERLAVRKIVQAEHIERAFASLTLPPDVRRDVDQAAQSLLTKTEVAYLSANAPPKTEVITVPDPVVVQPPKPVPAPQPPPAPPTADVPALIADGDRAIASGDLLAARSAYAVALQSPQLTHAQFLQIGEGLYRAHAFPDSVVAFDRAGAFAKEEAPFRYYYAVSLYEIGRYAAAKRELAAALPSIRITPDVERYRQKIEGAIE